MVLFLSHSGSAAATPGSCADILRANSAAPSGVYVVYLADDERSLAHLLDLKA
jgi:hypothetical protein